MKIINSKYIHFYLLYFLFVSVCVNRKERGSRGGSCSTSWVTSLYLDHYRSDQTNPSNEFAEEIKHTLANSLFFSFSDRVLSTSSLGSEGKRNCCWQSLMRIWWEDTNEHISVNTQLLHLGKKKINWLNATIFHLNSLQIFGLWYWTKWEYGIRSVIWILSS